jgi:hypothetical protein
MAKVKRVSETLARLNNQQRAYIYYVECEEFFFPKIRFVLSSNFGLLWKSYLLNHFFRDAILKKGVFEFLNQFIYFNHQLKFLIFLHNPCHDSLDHFFKP